MLKEVDFEHPQVVFRPEARERLKECIKFVNDKRPDLEDNLIKQFMGFNPTYWNEHPGMRLLVMSDFAPLSFYFIKEVLCCCKCDSSLWYDSMTCRTCGQKVDESNGEWKRDYNGGIIFHGNHDRGGDGGTPTFSVNITPVNGWATHT